MVVSKKVALLPLPNEDFGRPKLTRVDVHSDAACWVRVERRVSELACQWRYMSVEIDGSQANSLEG